MTSPADVDKLVEQIQREEDHSGQGVVTNDPSDSGGKTQWGLTEKDNPEEWADGVVTKEESANRIRKRYVTPFEGIRDTNLLHQLVDFGVNAGPQTAAKILQQLVGVSPDGQIGPQTVEAVENFPKGTLFGVPVPGFVLLNLAVRDAPLAVLRQHHKAFSQEPQIHPRLDEASYGV
jgi:lysozyme family protein